MDFLSFARVELGLSEAEFWRLTPAKFFAMADLRNEQIARRDKRSGMITRAIRLALGARSADWTDDFPEHKAKAARREKPADSPDLVRAKMQALIKLQKG